MTKRQLIALVTSCCFLFPLSVFCEPCVLNLQTALLRALSSSHSLKIRETDVEIKEGEKIQAGLPPNPEFVFEIDSPDLRRVNGERNGTDISYGISQKFEMGGKRRARVQFATSTQQVSVWELEAIRYEIREQVIHAFLAAALAQEKINLAVEQKELAEEIVRVVSEQVHSEKLSPIQQQKAEIVVATQEINLKKAQRDFALAKQRLALLWGSEDTDFEFVSYPFYELVPMDPFPNLCEQLLKHPLIMRWESEIQAAYDNLNLQLTERVPDVTIEAGVDQEQDCRNTSGYFELTVPLPFFNRNQGNIFKANQEIVLAEEKKMQAMTELQGKLKANYVEFESAYEQVILFDDKIMQKAKNSFEMIEEGFQEGKFSYLDVLEAQRTLSDNREHYVDILGEFHEKRQDILSFFAF